MAIPRSWAGWPRRTQRPKRSEAPLSRLLRSPRQNERNSPRESHPSALETDDRKIIGEDIKYVQTQWSVGKPTCGAMGGSHPPFCLQNRDSEPPIRLLGRKIAAGRPTHLWEKKIAIGNLPIAFFDKMSPLGGQPSPFSRGDRVSPTWSGRCVWLHSRTKGRHGVRNPSIRVSTLRFLTEALGSEQEVAQPAKDNES